MLLPDLGKGYAATQVHHAYRRRVSSTHSKETAGRDVTMRRRDVLVGAQSLAAGALSFPMPAIAQGIRQLKMVTDWPETRPGFHPSSVRLARTIEAATGGRIRVEVFPAGA